MPRITMPGESGGAQQTSPPNKIRERLQTGELVPLISAAVGDDLALGGHVELVKDFAKICDYRLDQISLPLIAQCKSITDENFTDPWAIKEFYIDFVKSRLLKIAEDDRAVEADVVQEVNAQFDRLTFSQFSEKLGYPRFTPDRSNPLLILAGFDLPIYITTGYHNFVEEALRYARKKPRTDFCRWPMELEHPPTDEAYIPNAHEPLVYHIHGYDNDERSLVLTEDEHLSFLVDCSQYIGRKGIDPVHSRVREALSTSSLMLLGYSLSSWEFRSILWGLIRHRSKALDSISIQLEPSNEEKTYFDKYLNSDKIKFKAYWGSVEKYLQSVAQPENKGEHDGND